MSEAQNPFASMFEMQRRAMEQGQRTLEQSVTMQQQLTDAFLDTMDSQRETQKKGVGVMKSATNAYLDAFETSMPGETAAIEDAHTAVDDQFEAFDEVHSQMWDAFERNVRENANAYRNVSDRYLTMMNDSLNFAIEANRQWQEQSVAATQAVEEGLE